MPFISKLSRLTSRAGHVLCVQRAASLAVELPTKTEKNLYKNTNSLKKCLFSEKSKMEALQVRQSYFGLN